MNDHHKTIVKDLTDFYLKLYTNKDIYNKRYFKYTPDDINTFLCEVLEMPVDSKGRPKQAEKGQIRKEILQLETIDEVGSYLRSNLKYDKSTIDSKEQILDEISLNELKYLYSKIYSCEVKSKMRKVDIFNSIEKYFDGIDRVSTMKP